MQKENKLPSKTKVVTNPSCLFLLALLNLTQIRLDWPKEKRRGRHYKHSMFIYVLDFKEHEKMAETTVQGQAPENRPP